MPVTNPSPPPEKNQVSDQAQISQMNQQVQGLMKKHNVNPQQLARLGDFAFSAIKDKTLWPMFKNAVVQSKMVDPATLKEGIDYKMLGQFVMAGKVAKESGGGM